MKTRFITLIVASSIISFKAYAQEEKGKQEQNMAAKWAPGSIFFGKINIGGEYNLKPKKVITFYAGIPFNKDIRFKVDEKKKTITQKTFSLMGGYRMYLGKKPDHGLYFEPYLKYLKHDASYHDKFSDTIINNGEMIIEDEENSVISKYSGFGAGAQLGVQFRVAERWIIDFYFLGPEANIASHRLSKQDLASGLPWTAQEAAEKEKNFKDDLDEIPFLGKKLKVTTDAANRKISSEYKGFAPGLRFGVSFGYRF